MMTVSRAQRCPAVPLRFMRYFLRILEYIPINAGGQSDKPAETVGEVALIKEAGLQRRTGGGNALLQQLFCPADTNIFQITVWCDAF